VRFKTGVYLSGLQPEALLALDHATRVYAEFDKECVCTSARGDRHSNYSHHYKGLAVDVRTRHLTEPQRIAISERLQNALGHDYQVILERTHLHIEYDPKQAPDYIF
jgi:hypothetical protein